MTDTDIKPKFQVGDCVRVVKIGGPKMAVAMVSRDIKGSFRLDADAPKPAPRYAYTVCWFDKDLHFQSFDFAERMLERAR